jgi:serine/threonine protein kinase/tetratricopeptide (TPR) repeat protein
MHARPVSIKAVFDRALEMESAGERKAYLDEACAAAPEFREKVEALLKAYDEAGSFLESPAAVLAATIDDPVTERPGTVLGPYKLMEQIGEGGMGLVFVAEQQQPVRRKVALKVIKPGMDTRQVIARFEAERQALALMDHPNIAKVLDGGQTANGRPYFVMELVKGVPITDYCDQNQVPIRQRLELFVDVCQAVQHAHQKGIIHRDLKPSNVLVMSHDGTPLVKVIDFGVAKAIGQQLTDKTIYTQFSQLIGTPLYMSPEQAGQSGLDVDTRSDIYSLGVLLYELLTGTTPFDKERLRTVGYDEMRRIIREEEPPKPSTRISTLGQAATTVSTQQQGDPKQLSRLFRGELDWIVMKALEKDRDRRYETANGFATDVQRYLRDEPVLACPPSARYRLSKFLRRNKGPVLAAGLVLLALVCGMTGTTWGLLSAQHARQLAETNEKHASAERDRAERERRIAEAVRTFLQKDLLRQADAWVQADSLRRAGLDALARENPTIKEVLDHAAAGLTEEKIESRFPKQPLVQAAILQTVGQTYDGIGDYGKAIAHLSRAVQRRRERLGPDHPDTLTALKDLGRAYADAGKYDLALPLLEHTLKVQEAELGDDHLDTLATCNNLGIANIGAGKYELALSLFVRALKGCEAKLGDDHPDVLRTRQNLAMIHGRTGQMHLAIPLLERTLQAQETALGDDHPETLGSRQTLALMYMFAGTLNLQTDKTARALPLFERTLKVIEVKLGRYHPNTIHCRAYLARTYLEGGKLDLAIPLLKRTVKEFEAKVGDDYAETLFCRNLLAEAYRRAGKLDLAIPLFERTLKACEAKLGDEHHYTLYCRGNLARAYLSSTTSDKALSQLARYWANAGNLRQRSPDIHTWFATLVCTDLLQAKQYAFAEPWLRECLAIRVEKAPDSWITSYTRAQLGEALLGQRKYGEAEPLLLQGYRGMKERQAQIPPQQQGCLTQARDRLVQLYQAWGKPKEAKEWREQP